MDLKSLLELGYFPIELPPPFTTQHLATSVDKTPAILQAFRSYKTETRLILHDIPRYGLYRRKLGIPNPIHYSRLADTVVSKKSIE